MLLDCIEYIYVPVHTHTYLYDLKAISLSVTAGPVNIIYNMQKAVLLLFALFVANSSITANIWWDLKVCIKNSNVETLVDWQSLLWSQWQCFSAGHIIVSISINASVTLKTLYVKMARLCKELYSQEQIYISGNGLLWYILQPIAHNLNLLLHPSEQRVCNACASSSPMCHYEPLPIGVYSRAARLLCVYQWGAASEEPFILQSNI